MKKDNDTHLIIIRQRVLQDLIRYRRPLEEIRMALTSFDWDCNEELIRLDRHYIIAVLERYLSGEITGRDVEEWADTIECREDIDYKQMTDLIYRLANPSATHELTPAIARTCINQLLEHITE